jgi:hypothetical protein
MAEPERYLFVHLQKTGGTALTQRLRASFGDDAVYPTPQDRDDVGSVLDVGYLLDRFRTDGDAIRVITGHFPYCTAELLRVPLETFTILREPVERTLSLLRKRQATDERYRGQELDEIYEDAALQDIIRNHMVKMLSLAAAEMGPTPLTLHLDVDEARLERAQEALEQIDVVGLQEHFDEFCSGLEARFGWDLGPPRFANRTERRPVPDGLRERIRSDNEMDHQLYEFAVRLVEARSHAPGRAHG